MSIVLRRINGGAAYTSGRLNEVFPQARSGDPTDYGWWEVYNAGPAAVSAGTVFLILDTSGAAVTIAVADGTARASSYAYAIDPATLTYSAPTTQLTGLTVPALAVGEKFLLAARRVLTGAPTARPETNRLRYKT